MQLQQLVLQQLVLLVPLHAAGCEWWPTVPLSEARRLLQLEATVLHHRRTFGCHSESP